MADAKPTVATQAETQAEMYPVERIADTSSLDATGGKRRVKPNANTCYIARGDVCTLVFGPDTPPDIVSADKLKLVITSGTSGRGVLCVKPDPDGRDVEKMYGRKIVKLSSKSQRALLESPDGIVNCRWAPITDNHGKPIEGWHAAVPTA